MTAEPQRDTANYYRMLRERHREGLWQEDEDEDDERVPEEEYGGDGRPSRRKLYAMWLGTLLSVPTVVTAYVNGWMARSVFGHRRSDGPSEEEAFSLLIEMILIGRSEMHLRIVRKTDPVLRSSRVTYEVSPLTLVDDHWNTTNFALSESTLRAALHEVEGKAGEVRLAVAFVYLLCNMDQTSRDEDGRDGGGVATKFRDKGMLMLSAELSIDNSYATLRNYIDQDLMDLCLHRSSFFIALGRYLLHTRSEIDARAEKRAGSAPKSSDADGDMLFKEAAGHQAQKDAIARLLEQYERALQSLTSRVKPEERIRTSELPSALCHYGPDDDIVEPQRDEHDQVQDDATVAGVPLAAMRNDAATFAWLQWVWEYHIHDRGIPLSRVLADAWTAKTFYLLDAYHAFMENTQHFVNAHMTTLSQTSRNQPIKRHRR